MKKELYFIKSNGHHLIVSLDKEKNCRYLMEDESFPCFKGNEDEDEVKEKAAEYLNSIEDDSDWKDDCSYMQLIDYLMSEIHTILARTEKEVG